MKRDEKGTDVTRGCDGLRSEKRRECEGEKGWKGVMRVRNKWYGQGASSVNL